MSAHKNIDLVCLLSVIISVLTAALFIGGGALGVIGSASEAGYKERLFSLSKVHTIDIVMDNWEEFISTCESEEYSECAVVIDGEAYKNVGIRGKGNTSLSSVASMGSERYSFKIEFDKYDKSKSYYGLDKLCLNNIIQDNTYMKDYLTYRMMNEFGVNAPLCSYTYITVNGEDWGLYLAVEGVEEAFLERCYGKDYGELYKPDSMSFGGGRGNGMNFKMDDFGNPDGENIENAESNFSFPRGGAPNSFDPSQISEGGFEPPEQGGLTENFKNTGKTGGMGSDDVKLKYIDDSYDSYPNIFDNAKTDVSDSDKDRLIASLKALGENTDIENTVDIDQVMRYFAVHNFVCNGDSYTGSMVHNYYLYEEDGLLSMIPWDYNLAFGTFQSGNASEQVNYPIDSPVSGDVSDRPMISWIFSDSGYTNLYHQYMAEFLDIVDIDSIIVEAAALISDYVEKDPTKFCTYEEFERGVSALRLFCELREESVRGQLEGSIPSTQEGQADDSSALIDTSELKLSEMGTMNNFGINGKRNENGNGIGIFGNAAEKNGEEASGDFWDKPDMPNMGGSEFPQDGNMNGDAFGAGERGNGGGNGEINENSGLNAFNNFNDKNNISDLENKTETNKAPIDSGNKEASAAEGGMSAGIWLAVSAAALAAGLLFALKFN